MNPDTIVTVREKRAIWPLHWLISQVQREELERNSAVVLELGTLASSEDDYTKVNTAIRQIEYYRDLVYRLRINILVMTFFAVLGAINLVLWMLDKALGILF